MTDPLDNLLNEKVVLDTATSIVYIGTLTEIGEYAFVLRDADMHDCRDGHANKEVYVAQMAEVFADQVVVNRRRIVVMRSTVISLSRLADVVVG